MNVKRDIESRVRGWFPQEPNLHTKKTAPTTIQTITNTLGSYSPAVIVVGIVCWFAVLSDSWIQIAALIGTTVLFLTYVSSRRHFHLRRVIRNVWALTMVCAIVFTAVETYMFWNAGYPPTYSQADPKTTLTMQGMLNASVLEIVQDIEQKPTFNLLKIEHNGEFKFHSMTFTPTDVGGYLEVNFFCEQDSTYAHFFSGNGNQYRLTAEHSDLIYPFDQSSNVVQQSLRQIDQVGLRGFYDQAIELASNKIANLSLIDTLDINIVYRSGEWVVQVIGHHNDGSIFGEDVIVSSFQPNGELISIHTLEATI